MFHNVSSAGLGREKDFLVIKLKRKCHLFSERIKTEMFIKPKAVQVKVEEKKFEIDC